MLGSKQSVLLGLALLVGCGSNGGLEEEEVILVDHGEGTVLFADPALGDIVPDDYFIEKLAGEMGFTEGPVWVREGSYLLFSDIPGNVINKWTPGGAVTEFLKPVFEGESARISGSNGLAIDSKGDLIICEHGNRCISRLSLATPGERQVMVDRYQGKRLNSPNDLAYKSDGWLYFTDPPYGLPERDEDPEKELDFNGIFRLSPDEKTLELLYRDMVGPNGIGFSPDEKTLYVADSRQDIWMAFDVQEDGSLANARVFYDVTSEADLEGAPDGLKLDESGNLYCTGPGGVWIFTPEGKHLGTIQPPEVPANVGWGDDGRTLYMTARTGLYRIRLKSEGIIS
jgi:gluconolactonase